LPPALKQALLTDGFAVASIDYAMRDDARFPEPMMDGARAVQFLRFNAGDLGLDPARVVLLGGSVGAGIALWVAYHDDLAKPSADDPVLRRSTRVEAVAVFNAQTTYKPADLIKIFGATRYPGFLRMLFARAPTDRRATDRRLVAGGFSKTARP
jgi:acetyl esterase